MATTTTSTPVITTQSLVTITLTNSVFTSSASLNFVDVNVENGVPLSTPEPCRLHRMHHLILYHRMYHPCSFDHPCSVVCEVIGETSTSNMTSPPTSLAADLTCHAFSAPSISGLAGESID